MRGKGRIKRGEEGFESNRGERGEERRGGGERKGRGGKREKTQYRADETNRNYRLYTVK